MNKRLPTTQKEKQGKKWKNNGLNNGKAWYLNANCYNTETVKWLLSQDRGADIFVFYQRLFILTVEMERENLSFHEIDAAFRKTGLFSGEFIEYAISVLNKTGLVEEMSERVNGAEIISVYLPDNDILRRNI